MTREEFQRWTRNTVRYFRGDPNRMTRQFAESVRPFDPDLADLYVKLADAHDTIRLADAHDTIRRYLTEKYEDKT